ncbi:MAG: CBS domain-containing protein [Gammaproteobacteria bacterium]
MATIRLKQSVNADIQSVWSVISDFSRLAEFEPEVARATVVRGTGADAVLRLVNYAGQVWEERCVAYAPNDSYTLKADADSLPFPYAQRERVVSVVPDGDEVSLEYELRYRTRLWPVGAWRASSSRTGSMARQTLEAMLHAIRDDQWRHTITVQTILNRKGASVVSASPRDTIASVAGLLMANRIGAVLVLDDERKLVGLVSERDIAYGLASAGPELLTQTADSIMSTNLIVCAPEHDMEFVMVCMTDKRIRHLPVMDGETLLGIVSIGDVVWQRIAALEAQSQTMRDYIESREWRHFGPPGAEPE